MDETNVPFTQNIRFIAGDLKVSKGEFSKITE
jgi:hypothetical protein